MGRKKVTTIRVDEDYIKLAKYMGWSVSRLVERILREVLAGREEELKKALEREVEAKLEEIRRRVESAFVCDICGCEEFRDVERIHELRRVQCVRCGQGYVYDGRRREWMIERTTGS